MRLALEIVGLSKRFIAGAGSCLATAQALTDIDLAVAEGESLAVVGPSGAGKTTLLLCAAGLLAPDTGVVRWCGDSNRAAAMRRIRLCYHRGIFAEPHPDDGPRVHLIDVGDAESARARVWIEERCGAGDSVLVALRDASVARGLANRIVALRGGRIVPAGPARARVAEPVFVDPPLRHA